MISDSAILQHIDRQPKRSAGFKQLVRELGLHGSVRGELDRHLQKLVASGQLVQINSDRYALPQSAPEKAGKNAAVGRLTMHRDGFGFVIPDSSSLNPHTPHPKPFLPGDFSPPPHLIGNAMQGDRVLVDIAAIRPDGRAEGRIVRPVVRAHPTVVGTFPYGSRHNYVKPIDSKITQEIVIPTGAEIAANATDSNVYPLPPLPPVSSVVEDLEPQRSQGAQGKKKSVDRVLGDEAARRTDWDDLEGVAVDVEITDWPSPTQNPRGRVIEILGRPDDFGVGVDITIRKFHLPHHFPAATLQEAQDISAVIPAKELHRRPDFQPLPIAPIAG